MALILNWKSRPRRNLILISFAIYIVVIVVTQIYFLPELGAFESSAGSNLSRAEWLTRGQRWQRLSWIRGAVMYVTILPLLLALTKPANIPKESVAAAAIGKKTLTGPSRHQRALAIQESIREILWHDWDPIGVNDVPEASDEYDAYVGGVYRLLASRCSAEQLIDHLFNIETRTMGLTTPGCEHLRPVAAKLLRLNVSL